MIFIAEPFKIDIDVTDESLLSDIPVSYGAGLKTRLAGKEQRIRDVQAGVEQLSVNLDLEDFILKEIHLSVSSHDDHVIKTVFHTAISAYASPLNLALKCESGSGKSYGTTETVKFLPGEDVLFIGSQSPKVISHENGVRKTRDGRNFEEIPEPCKPDRSDEPDASMFYQLMKNFKEEVKAYRKLQDECCYEVDLRGKIIVFLESVNSETFRMLKATMSHDHDWVDHKYVDDKGKVHLTRLVGAPVLIFNSLDSNYLSEFATRTLTVTPNTSKEKIEAAMQISNRKSCFPWLFDAERLNKTIIQEYMRKVRDSLKAGRIKTINPFLGIADIFCRSQVRDMRDFNKFLELMPAYAIVKLYQRPIVIIKNQRYIVPTVQDFLDAKAVFDSVSETTKTGTEQRIISFYWDCVADKVNGSTVDVLTELYNKDRKQKLSSRRIREWLERLVEIEFVDPREGEQQTAAGYVDKQKMTYHPLKKAGNNVFLATATDLKAKLETEFDKWLKNVAEDIASHPIIILNVDGTANQISVEVLTKVVRGETVTFTATFSKAESNLIGEIRQKNNAIGETAENTRDFTVLNYCKLAPNKPSKCDGEAVGSPCALEAQYEMLSSDNLIRPRYCENHFQLTRVNCESNGFRLLEQQPQIQQNQSGDYPVQGAA